MLFGGQSFCIRPGEGTYRETCYGLRSFKYVVYLCKAALAGFLTLLSILEGVRQAIADWENLPTRAEDALSPERAQTRLFDPVSYDRSGIVAQCLLQSSQIHKGLSQTDFPCGMRELLTARAGGLVSLVVCSPSLILFDALCKIKGL